MTFDVDTGLRPWQQMKAYVISCMYNINEVHNNLQDIFLPLTNGKGQMKGHILVPICLFIIQMKSVSLTVSNMLVKMVFLTFDFDLRSNEIAPNEIQYSETSKLRSPLGV